MTEQEQTQETQLLTPEYLEGLGLEKLRSEAAVQQTNRQNEADTESGQTFKYYAPRGQISIPTYVSQLTEPQQKIIDAATHFAPVHGGVIFYILDDKKKA